MAKQTSGVSDEGSGVITIDVKELMTPLSIVLGAIIIAIVVFFTNGGDSKSADGGAGSGGVTDTTQPTVADPEPQGPVLAAVSIDDDAIVGDRNRAKVAVVEFSDFNCGFCQRHHQETFPQINDEYVKDGRVIMVARDYVGVGGDTTRQAAAAAECVREQVGDSGYMVLLKGIYDASGTKDVALVKSLSSGLDGFNSGTYDSCIESTKFLAEVDKDTQDGQAAGINGTPGFVVGVLDGDGNVVGEVVSGAHPYSVFKATIDKYLDQ